MVCAHRNTTSNHENVIVALSQDALPTDWPIHSHRNMLHLNDLLNDCLR